MHDERDFAELEDEDIDGINVTPMVNLSLVLVMIFIVTSPYFVKDLMPAVLPQAVTSRTEDQKNIAISISPEEGFAINEVPVLKRDIIRELTRVMRTQGKTYVLIRADERVPHGEVEDIMKISKKVGVERIAFATVPKI